MPPIVSICLPPLDSGAFLESRLDSIAKRTLQERVFIAYDSYSSHGTMATDRLEKMVSVLDSYPQVRLAHCMLQLIDGNDNSIENDWWQKRSMIALSSGSSVKKNHLRSAPLGVLYFADTWTSLRVHDDQATTGANVGSTVHCEKVESMTSNAMDFLQSRSFNPKTLQRVAKNAPAYLKFHVDADHHYGVFKRNLFILKSQFTQTKPASINVNKKLKYRCTSRDAGVRIAKDWHRSLVSALYLHDFNSLFTPLFHIKNVEAALFSLAHFLKTIFKPIPCTKLL